MLYVIVLLFSTLRTRKEAFQMKLLLICIAVILHSIKELIREEIRILPPKLINEKETEARESLSDTGPVSFNGQ